MACIVNVLTLQPNMCYKYASCASCGCCAWEGYDNPSMLGCVGVPWARKWGVRQSSRGMKGGGSSIVNSERTDFAARHMLQVCQLCIMWLLCLGSLTLPEGYDNTSMLMGVGGHVPKQENGV